MDTHRHLMLAPEGTAVPIWLEKAMTDLPASGVTLSRELNLESPTQIAELVSSLQERDSSVRIPGPHPIGRGL